MVSEDAKVLHCAEVEYSDCIIAAAGGEEVALRGLETDAGDGVFVPMEGR